MGGDRGYLIALLLIAIPFGLFLAQLWARSRSPGAVRLDAHADPAEAPPSLSPEMELQPEPPASGDPKP